MFSGIAIYVIFFLSGFSFTYIHDSQDYVNSVSYINSLSKFTMQIQLVFAYYINRISNMWNPYSPVAVAILLT